MRLKIFSDIHLEFSNAGYDHIWQPNPEDRNTILLLAGDIGVGMQARTFVEELCKNFHSVLLICGNHEFYGQEYMTVLNGWKNFEENEADKNFHFLDRDTRIIDGVRFIGDTMWTSFEHGDQRLMARAEYAMNDYGRIKVGDNFLKPAFTFQRHTEFINYLEQKLAEPFDGKTVVMTHHSPLNYGRIKYHGPSYDPFYFACLENRIKEWGKPDLWVHGHAHVSHDTQVGNTRILANPHGYLNYSVNTKFNKDIIIEL